MADLDYGSDLLPHLQTYLVTDRPAVLSVDHLTPRPQLRLRLIPYRRSVETDPATGPRDRSRGPLDWRLSSVRLAADGRTAQPWIEFIQQLESQSEITPLKRQLDFMPQHVFPHATNGAEGDTHIPDPGLGRTDHAETWVMWTKRVNPAELRHAAADWAELEQSAAGFRCGIIAVRRLRPIWQHRRQCTLICRDAPGLWRGVQHRQTVIR